MNRVPIFFILALAAIVLGLIFWSPVVGIIGYALAHLAFAPHPRDVGRWLVRHKRPIGWTLFGLLLLSWMAMRLFFFALPESIQRALIEPFTMWQMIALLAASVICIVLVSIIETKPRWLGRIVSRTKEALARRRLVTLAAVLALLVPVAGCTSGLALLNKPAGYVHKATAKANAVDTAGTVEERRQEALEADLAYKAAKIEHAASKEEANALMGAPAK